MSCGTALVPNCPNCGTENPPSAKFCIECGTQLGAGGSTVDPPPQAPAPSGPAAAGVRFLLRVGVNSGEVLAGQVGGGYTVMGDVVNVAARLQTAARPGSVTVAEITQRLTRGAIEYEPLEPFTLKGKSEPVPAW